MAITIPIVTEFVDKGITAAQASFANFKNKVGEAEGAMGKLKAGSGAAFDAIKANAGAMALGAGAAIATFAAKAIGEFQNLALEVDKFSNSTGLAAEEASRYIEVAGDIGVESGTLLTAFNRLNRAVGDNSAAFADLGVEISRTSSGATDVNQTFLDTIDALRRIDDPAQRARLATQLLGKSWTELSELVEMGANGLSAALEDVAGAKIIDEAEIAKAKELRAAQDALQDAFDELVLTLGESLVPALTQATNAAVPLLNVFLPLIEAVGGAADANASYAEQVSNSNVQMNMGMKIAEKFFGWLGFGSDQTEELTDETEFLTEAWKQGTRAMINARQATDDLTASMEDVDYALEVLKGNVDDRRQWDNLITAIDDAKQAAITAFFEATPEALRESQRETDDARVKVAEYIAQMEGIPLEKKTEMIAALDRANLAEIEATLAELSRTRNVTFRIRTVGGIPVAPGETPSEVRRSLNLRSNSPNVTVNVGGSVIAERDLVETVRKGLVDSQRNGNQLIYTNR